MGSGLAESLRATTLSARAAADQAAAIEESEAPARARKAEATKAAAIEAFVAKKFQDEVDDTLVAARLAAGEGGEDIVRSYDVTWERRERPDEDIAQRTALRNSVAEHFMGLEFEVELIDGRHHTPSEKRPEDEGWWAAYDTQAIGFRLSWAEQSEQQV